MCIGREWGIYALKCLLENNIENQRIVESVPAKPTKVTEEGEQILQSMGMQGRIPGNSTHSGDNRSTREREGRTQNNPSNPGSPGELEWSRIDQEEYKQYM